MSDGGISIDERRRVRLARLTVYTVPAIAGLVTLSIAALHDVIGLPGGPQVGNVVLVGNAALAGFASAYLVTRLHPVERGKWRKGATSFLISFLMAWAATVVFAMLAARFTTT